MMAESLQAGKMRSVEALRAVAKVGGITKTERIVLTVLAEHAGEGENGLECYPGISTIATKAHCSPRQAKRVVRSLRQKSVIHFEDNAGGKGKSNRYLLLFANGDTSNGDILNSDRPKGDILNAKGDISSTQTVTNLTQRVTFQTPNGDTAMSPEGFEWFEGFNEWKEWKTYPPILQIGGVTDRSSEPSKFLNYVDLITQVERFEERPEDLLRQILNGVPIQRSQECDCKGHGVFTRTGYRVGNWIAWSGHSNCYSTGWSDDAGCPACVLEREEDWKGEPEAKRERVRNLAPVRRFDLSTPATCPDHGHFIFHVNFTEFSKYYEQHGGKRFRVDMDYMCGCPGCDSEYLYEEQVREELALSVEEWERGGKQIIAAIDYAKQPFFPLNSAESANV